MCDESFNMCSSVSAAQSHSSMSSGRPSQARLLLITVYTEDLQGSSFAPPGASFYNQFQYVFNYRETHGWSCTIKDKNTIISLQTILDSCYSVSFEGCCEGVHDSRAAFSLLSRYLPLGLINRLNCDYVFTPSFVEKRNWKCEQWLKAPRQPDSITFIAAFLKCWAI